MFISLVRRDFSFKNLVTGSIKNVGIVCKKVMQLKDKLFSRKCHLSCKIPEKFMRSNIFPFL